MNLRIRTKLLLLFLVLAFGPMVTVGIVSYYHTLRSVEAVVEQEAMHRAGDVAAGLTRLYEDVWSEARLLVRNRNTQDLYDAYRDGGRQALDKGLPELEEFFGQFFTASRQAFCRVRFYDAGGVLIFEYGRPARAAVPSVQYSFSPTDSSTRLELKTYAQGVQAVSNEFDPAYGALLRLGSWVQTTEDGPPVGFALADVQVEWFLRDSQLSPDPARHELLALVGRDVERIVAHPQGAAIGHSFPSAFPQIDVTFSELADQRRGWVWCEGEGDEVSLVTYVNLEEVPWTLLTVNQQGAVTAGAQQAAFINLGIILAAAVLALVLIPVTIGSITTSIRRVADGAEALADGYLDHEISVTTGDETRDLANSFNRMARSLKSTLGELQTLTDSLEDRVQLRTVELEEAHRRIVETNRDLTESKEIAETANRAKSEFLANISHEIRTPMNAILGYAQIMQRGSDLSPRDRQAVETIQHSGDHLLKLINDVLDLSKIEAGRMELNRADFDLHEVVANLAVMFELRCKEKGLDWQLEGMDGGPVWVHGDESKLRQVLMNLLSNAVKFTDEGRVLLRVARAADGARSFDVVDSGVGISADDQTRLFDPFEQGEAGERFGGTGLGLAIGRRHAELMGGEIIAKSAVGQGSVFTLTVPLPAADEGAEEREDRDWSSVRRLAPGIAVRALVADDVRENRDVLRRFLEDLGLQVQTAVDGVEAVALQESFRPDIVFMDVRMPKMDGVEALQQIRTRVKAEGGPPKVVAISASVLEHEQRQFLAAGFDGFVAKPFRFESICGCLFAQLGVAFETTESASREPEARSDWRGVEVPADLLSRLVQATELYSVTELETYLKELEQLGTEPQKLATHLRRLRQRFDLDSIRSTLAELAVG